MAKTKKKKCGISKKCRSIIAISVAIVVVALTLLILLVWKPFENKTEEPQNTPETSEEAKEETEPEVGTGEAEVESDEDESSSSANSTPQTPAQYEGSSADEQDTLSGVISYVGYGDDDYLLVQATISQRLGNEGTCKLTMTKKTTGSKITRTVKTASGISTSECSDFKILNSHVPSGEYDVIIEIEGSGKTGRLETTANI